MRPARALRAIVMGTLLANLACDYRCEPRFTARGRDDIGVGLVTMALEMVRMCRETCLALLITGGSRCSPPELEKPVKAQNHGNEALPRYR